MKFYFSSEFHDIYTNRFTIERSFLRINERSLASQRFLLNSSAIERNDFSLLVFKHVENNLFFFFFLQDQVKLNGKIWLKLFEMYSISMLGDNSYAIEIQFTVLLDDYVANQFYYFLIFCKIIEWEKGLKLIFRLQKKSAIYDFCYTK